jgi:hypothetical protein
MSWGNETAVASAQPGTAPFSVEERDRRLAAWDEAKKVLEAAKATEGDCRKAVFEYCFPNPKEGTNRIELNNGYALKAVNKINYKIAAPNAAVDAVQDEAEKLGNEGTFLIERIITWTPNFSKSEYTKLDVSLPVHAKIKQLVDSVLEIKPGMPTLEIEEPKAKLNG